MLKRIKDINEALPGMLLIECIYLVVAQIIIFIAVPNVERDVIRNRIICHHKGKIIDLVFSPGRIINDLILVV